MCITLGGELEASEDGHFQNITKYKNGRVNSLQDRTLSKICIILKIISNKSC